MCLIVHKPQEAEFGEELVRRAFNANDDGFGIMYTCGLYPECKKVHHVKTVGTVNDALELYRPLQDKELAMHFRMATHGAHNVANAHPYSVLNTKEHGMDVMMMHNGIMSFVPLKDKTMSDSFNFAKHWLRPMLAHDYTILYEEAFQKTIAQIIGKGNKLLFLDGTGKFTYVNSDQGSVHETGCWISNEYSLWPRRTYFSSAAWKGWGDDDWDGDGTSMARAAWEGRTGNVPLVSSGVTSTGADVKLLPPPAKSAAESASVFAGTEAEEVAEAVLRRLHNAAEDAEGLSPLDGEDDDDPWMAAEVERRIRAINAEGIDENDFRNMDWKDVYQVVMNYPEEMADFLYTRFS